jgi:hypothetical protein
MNKIENVGILKMHKKLFKVDVTFSKKIELDISTYTAESTLFNGVVEKIMKNFLQGVKYPQSCL